MKTFFKKIGLQFYIQIFLIAMVARSSFKHPIFFNGLSLGLLIGALAVGLVGYFYRGLMKDELD